MGDPGIDHQPALDAESPLVSVVMSVHNDEPFVREAVDSILQQTYAPLEFIIVNDGSTDASGSIIQRRAAQDERIILIDRDQNRGLTASLIEGCEAARGKYIARQDADDISHPARLEQLVQILESDDNIVLAGTSANRIDVESKTVKQLFIPCRPVLVRLFLRWHNHAIHGSTMFRADAYRTVGGYRLLFERSQDVDLWLRLSTLGSIVNLREVLYSLRSHGGQVSGTMESDQVDQAALAHVMNRAERRGRILQDEGDWTVGDRVYYRVFRSIQKLVRSNFSIAARVFFNSLNRQRP